MAPWSMLLLCCFCARGERLGDDTESPDSHNTMTEDLEVDEKWPSFDEFIVLHHRGYEKGSTEYKQRQDLFEQRVARAKESNREPGRTWFQGVNKFSDWNEHELDGLHGWRHSIARNGSLLQIDEQDTRKSYTASEKRELKRLEAKPVDYGSLKASQRIWNQESCGSCWAMTTVAVLQAHSEIYSKKDRTFSPQELVDCTPNPQECGGKGGCKGGTVELGMEYVLRHGLSTEVDYPYLAKTASCRKVTSSAAVIPRTPLEGYAAGIYTVQEGSRLISSRFGLVGWEKLPENKALPLLRALVALGPVAISVTARTWHVYSRGIFSDCSKDAILGHAVVLVGFGGKGDKKYWKIQNSWGSDWGENGFIRLKRWTSEEKFCGIDNQPRKGVGCIGGPDEVPVCGMCGMLYDSVVPHFRTKNATLALLYEGVE
eukprot:TRINITY_DN68403_c0_g1_i1.p1 TRINITY_DN68403_c0_g1~~TRINITY_DN68403_c0_g1_i1.p1  ORF type:complete len:465 (-),score=62.19 TRINITY_DN68403_c0_g1_i1:234-1520(-)